MTLLVAWHAPSNNAVAHRTVCGWCMHACMRGSCMNSRPVLLLRGGSGSGPDYPHAFGDGDAKMEGADDEDAGDSDIDSEDMGGWQKGPLSEKELEDLLKNANSSANGIHWVCANPSLSTIPATAIQRLHLGLRGRSRNASHNVLLLLDPVFDALTPPCVLWNACSRVAAAGPPSERGH